MKIRLFIFVMLFAASIPLSAQIEVVSGGNVGVGTSSPGNKFTVEGTGDVASFGSSTKKFYFTPDANGVALFTGATKTGNGLYANSTSNYFSLSTNSTERLRIDASGNVGIGTSTPGTALDVASGIVRVNGVGPGHGSIYGATALSPEIFSNGGTSDFWFYTPNSSYTDLVLSTGYNGDNTLNIRYAPGTLGAGAGVLQIGQLVKQVQPTFTHGITEFFTNGVERVRIDVSGNVGIGTTTPGQKLEVAGSVRATSFISNSTTYADFVFDPDYRLPALSEVEAKIKELGHLPGIPSEAEAKAHGIDLTAMQVKLLQKIEELTLHIIAQEKQLRAQKTRIERLEAGDTQR